MMLKQSHGIALSERQTVLQKAQGEHLADKSNDDSESKMCLTYKECLSQNEQR